MKRFNDLLHRADVLTNYSCDTASINRLIWILVQMGHLELAIALRGAAEAIGYIKGVRK